MNPVEHYLNIDENGISDIINLKSSFYESNIGKYSTDINSKNVIFLAFTKLYPTTTIKKITRYSGMINGEFAYTFYIIFNTVQA